MRLLRIAVAVAVLAAAAGILVLVALPREAPSAAVVTTERGGMSVTITPREGLFGDPEVRGLCLVFDRGRLRPSGLSTARGTLVIHDAGGESRYTLALGRGEYVLCLPTPGLTGGPATRFGLTWQSGEPPVLDAVEPLVAAEGAPIAADLGAILEYRRDRWRNPRYELYTWSSLPSILIFDTASYEVQDAFFKRLAFFVEKKGYVGTIPDTRSIADLHGFNAHDYRAADLARFYRTAAATGVTLLPEEIELRDILLEAGVILRREGSWAEGVGGVLSISRGTTTTAARARLLSHESLHGVYFASETFRAAVEASWTRTTDDLKEFFRLYFSYPQWGYDVDNPYLLKNEFMAYLLQYTREDARQTLFSAGARSLVDRFPARRAWIIDFLANGETGFLRAHEELERALWRELGLRGGELVSLTSLR